MNFIDRNLEIWASFRRLPLWVQIWVNILVLVNAASFAMLDTTAGQWTAIAAIFVVLTNVPIMYLCRGMNKLMSVPHLVAWFPLVILLAADLLSAQPAIKTGTVEYFYALIVIVVNSISLAFDCKDSWEWLRGDRQTP